jgi:hypothetical protein
MLEIWIQPMLLSSGILTVLLLLLLLLPTPDQLPTFQNLNFACNASELLRAHAVTGVPGVLSIQDCWQGVWNRSSAIAGDKAGVAATGLDRDWRANLEAQLSTGDAGFRSGALAGVFLGDEMMCGKIPFKNYSAVAKAVRAHLTKALALTPAAADAADPVPPLPRSRPWIYSNDCVTPLEPEHAGDDWAIPAKLPEELDYFSIDYYVARLQPATQHGGQQRATASDPSSEAQQVRVYVETLIKPRLHPHQRVMVVRTYSIHYTLTLRCSINTHGVATH